MKNTQISNTCIDGRVIIDKKNYYNCNVLVAKREDLKDTNKQFDEIVLSDLIVYPEEYIIPCSLVLFVDNNDSKYKTKILRNRFGD